MSNRGNIWVNADGLKVGFGARTTANEDTGHIETDGLNKELIRKISPATIAAAAGAAPFNDDIAVPAGSLITVVGAKVYEAFDDTFVVNLVDKEGTIVEAAVLDGAGASAVGAIGGVLATQILTTEPLWLSVVGTPTEGYAELYVEYNVSTSNKL